MQNESRAGEVRLTLIYVLTLGLLVALYRLAPYVLESKNQLFWNLAPMGALALFVGSRLRSNFAFLIPLGAMLLADLLLIVPLARMGYSAFMWSTPLIYFSFALYVLLGRLLPAQSLSPGRIMGIAVLASVQFFLITNFAVWLAGSTYPKTLEGLLTCYAMGAPFYRNTLLSDLIFSGLFFYLHAALSWQLSTSKDKEEQPA